ncbi:hypothetical protein MAR_004287 [Mya arenaria]|uniref:Uncharacterized protein n=1 Tax=Mya arenaria TaxID=6604 RepID=A0ABY7EW44_MYAAR|nr:hypothetical protein MAR_004287 [Mya arenaria]
MAKDPVIQAIKVTFQHSKLGLSKDFDQESFSTVDGNEQPKDDRPDDSVDETEIIESVKSLKADKAIGWPMKPIHFINGMDYGATFGRMKSKASYFLNVSRDSYQVN